MGKNKKASMSHEEIWDDSALVQSWDDAVEEYQLYHSIHAKGENVEDVLKAAEDSGATSDTKSIQEEAEDTTNNDTTDPQSEDVAMVIDESISESAPQASQPAGVATPDTGAIPVPHQLMANVKDEALKNLMMSWYYAGYYTGLYEGQQQASQNKST